MIKGDFDENIDQPRIKVIFADDYLSVNVCDMWWDIKTTGLDNEGIVELTNGKKPEALLKRIIEIFSNKNDIVLDAFAGKKVFYNNYPKCHKFWCEIDDDRDFFRGKNPLIG